MSAGSSAALTEAMERWNAVVDTIDGDLDALALQLAGVVDTLDGNAALRRALTDPGRSGEDKAALDASVFGAAVSSDVTDLVAGMARTRWSRDTDFSFAVERLGLETLLAHAEKAGVLEKMTHELYDFARLLERERELRIALSGKDASRERRVALLHDVVGDSLLPETVAVIDRTVSSVRYRSIIAALTQVATHASERMGRRTAVVTAAIPLSDQQIERLERALTARYGIPVRANVVVEPSVVGGIRVAIGNELVDDTIATRIGRLRRDVAEN
ncbi:MAG: F0F1 ATP synthase subunit delta [Ruaniaceae bacterium]|nr:F0F1 ATP synthase subunit delta [Ruaniaceae bacterium]